MNRINAIRHTLSKLKKYNKNQSLDVGKVQVLKEMFYNIEGKEIYYCGGCIDDDFGYCYHRNTDLSDEEVFNKSCCNQMIDALERQLY